MKNLFALCYTVFIVGQTIAQSSYSTTDTAYIKLVESAFTALKTGDCETCLMNYEKAFVLSQNSILSQLRAANCAYICKNEPVLYKYLDFVIEKDYGIVEGLLTNTKQYPEFNPSKDSGFYKIAFEKIKETKKKTGYDEALAAELDIIFKDDQELRKNMGAGKDTRQKMIEIDSLNQIKIEKIFAQHGYPGKSKVGKFKEVAFYVVQHAELPFQEKYYALLEEAAKKGEFPMANFALLIDRIRMRKGQKQLYGSQLKRDAPDKDWYVYPIEDEINVNKRRASVGLEPLEKYLEHFGIDYKISKSNN